MDGLGGRMSGLIGVGGWVDWGGRMDGRMGGWFNTAATTLNPSHSQPDTSPLQRFRGFFATSEL